MASEIWTSVPPSEPGWYWWKMYPDAAPEAVSYAPGGRAIGPAICRQGKEGIFSADGEFGPRIPSAAELHQHAEAMHANVVARAEAERRCRELEKERIGLLHTLLMIADRDIRDHDDYKAMAQWCVACAASEKPRERVAKP